MSSYKTGTTSNTIFATADINTVGIAHTRVAVCTPAPGSTIVTTKTSADASGDIRRADMGTAQACAGNRLVIYTEISLAIVPEGEREDEFNRLSAKYCVEGGTDGQKSFDAPDSKTPSNHFAAVVLRKTIHLEA